MASYFAYAFVIIFGIPLLFLIGFLLHYIIFNGYIFAFTGSKIKISKKYNTYVYFLLGLVYGALLVFFKQGQGIVIPFDFIYFFFGIIGLYYFLSLFVSGDDRVETLKRTVFATAILLMFWYEI